MLQHPRDEPIILRVSTNAVGIVPVKLEPVPFPPDIQAQAAWATPPAAWAGSSVKVIASIDPTHHGDLLHVSIAHRVRNPTWEEIRQVRDLFFPDTIDVMMMLPKAVDYVNIHEHCFHLWQTPVEWAIQ